MKVHSTVDIITNSSSVVFTFVRDDAVETLNALVEKFRKLGKDYTVKKTMDPGFLDDLRKGHEEFLSLEEEYDLYTNEGYERFQNAKESWTEEEWQKNIEREIEYRLECQDDFDGYTTVLDGNGETLDIKEFLNLFIQEASYN